MPEVTIKAIEQLLDKKLDEKLDAKLKFVASKGDITSIKGDISAIRGDVTAIRTGMVNLATQESLNELGGRLTTMEGILNQHTTSLDAISKDTSNWNTEMIVMRDRMKRYEDALKLVGQKLNLDLQSLLH